MPQRGFTLVEILVVIAIVGLLSSIIFAITRGTNEQGRIAKGLYFSQHLQNSLGAYAVGIWRFDEGEGTTAYDYSGWDNDGTIYGATYTTDTPSGKGYALSFNGSSDYVNAGTNSIFDFTSEDFTLEAWVKPSSFPSGGRGIVTRGGWQSNGWKMMVTMWRQFQFYTFQTGTYQQTNTGVMPSWDAWYHVVVTRQSASVKIYVNGQDATDVADSHVDPTSCVRDLYVGSSTGGLEPFPGFIDEVRIYSRALTAAEIQQRYAESAHKYHFAQQNS
jgi:prepilin-type N-terminal cleavage/methylation domain-containing protein